MPPLSSARWALPALILGALAIAFSAIFVRWSEVGPVATAFWRMTLALPLMLMWARRDLRRAPRTLRFSELRVFILAGAFFAADLSLWHWSLGLTTVANATFLANLAPVVVAVAAWHFFGERATPRFFAGMALGIVGAALLVRASADLSARALLGDALGVATAFFYAGYQLTIKRLRGSYPVSLILLVTGVASAVFLLPIAWMTGEIIQPHSALGWTNLLLLAVMCQFGGQGLITYAIAHLSASFSSVGLLAQPVFATLLAWILFGEAVGPLQFWGGMAVLAGIALARGASRNTHTTLPLPSDKL